MKLNASITMNAALLNRLRQTANLEKRSLSRQIELLVERHFASLPAVAPPPAGNAAPAVCSTESPVS